MDTFGITSFPLSKFHILPHGTNNFLSAKKFKPVHETLQFQTQVSLSNNPSTIHNQGLNEFFGTIPSTLCRTETLHKLQ